MHTIPCPTCHGEKRIPLPAQLADTLAYVDTLGSPTAPEIHKQFGGKELLGVTVTAINNRLDQLLDLGLVTRARWGKSYKWSVARKGGRR